MRCYQVHVGSLPHHWAWPGSWHYMPGPQFSQVKGAREKEGNVGWPVKGEKEAGKGVTLQVLSGKGKRKQWGGMIYLLQCLVGPLLV